MAVQVRPRPLIMENRIEKALKRLENAEPKLHMRGGKVVKIPAQEVKLPEKDGVITVYLAEGD